MRNRMIRCIQVDQFEDNKLYHEDGDIDLRFNLLFNLCDGFVRTYCNDNLSMLEVTLNFNMDEYQEFSRQIYLLFSHGYTYFKTSTGLLFEYAGFRRYIIDGKKTIEINFIREVLNDKKD